jgi:hypothetical protein
MKNQKINFRSLIATLISVAFVFALCLSSAQEAAAQRYLTELRTTSEARGLSQFATILDDFLSLADTLDQSNIVSPRDAARLEAAGKKVKDAAPNFRQSLEGLIAKIKKDNQWNDALDSEILGALGNRRIKGFFQNNGGGRRILTEAVNALNVIPREVDAIINNAKKSQAANFSGGGIFLQTSFAASSSARKVRFKCVLLGIAIFGSELLKADKTAENLDKIFDKSCGAGATTAT